MKHSFFNLFLLGVACMLLLSCSKQIAETQTSKQTPSIDLSSYTLSGANVLAFGPNGVLFIGNSKSGKVYAVPTNATALEEPIPFNIFAADRMIAEKLNVLPSELIINDLQIHPTSQEAYIAFKNGHAPSAKSHIAIISPVDHSIRLLDVVNGNIGEVSLRKHVQRNSTFIGIDHLIH